MEQEPITIKKEELLPYIKKAWREMQAFLHDQRQKFGARYNYRNNFELVDEKFGNAFIDPGKYADEYLLIQAKQSKLPASVRMVVQQIGARAINMLMLDKQMELRKQIESGKLSYSKEPIEPKPKGVTLQVGDVFQQAWKGCKNPLAFRVLSIDREKNSLRVKVIGNGANHEEDWDDLDVTETAFEVGEYKIMKLREEQKK